MWANMLRAFQVWKALISDGEPSSWMRPSRVAWTHVSCLDALGSSGVAWSALRFFGLSAQRFFSADAGRQHTDRPESCLGRITMIPSTTKRP